MAYSYKHQKKYFQSEKGKAAIRKYQLSDKGHVSNRKRRAKNHAKNREIDNEASRQHYLQNKEYHRQKNKEYNEQNGDKWKARRTEISLEWSYNRCSPYFVESVFNSLGSILTVEDTITFPQLCSLIRFLGYELEDVDYKPFINRYKYFKKKKVDWL